MSYPNDKDPNIVCLLQTLAVRDHQLMTDPIVFPTVAEDMNVRASDSFSGRYRGATKEIHGDALPKRQDTYISGTAGRVGRAFTATGTWNDFQTDYSGVYGVIQQSNALDVAYTLLSTDTTVGIENCTMYVGRGALPAATASAYTFGADNTYLYIYLAWGSKVDFRIALEYRRPMRIDRTQDTWATYEKVAISRDLGDTERFFATHSHKLPIDVHVNRANHQLVVEFGDGKELATTPYSAADGMVDFDKNYLPTIGKIRLSGKNGACSFEYYPKRYQAIVAKVRKNIGKADHPNAGQAVVVTNSRAKADPSQTVSFTSTPNGPVHEIGLTVTQPDQGDGLGSSEPSKLVDATLIIPAQWTTVTLGSGGDSIYPRVIELDYWQEWDDNTNTFTSGGHMVVENTDGLLTGLWGNRAADIWGTAGDSYYKLLTGIAGDGPGVTSYRQDTLGRLHIPLHDLSEKMKHPIGQRIILDRMCLYNAIHLVATLGGIHSDNLALLPQYIPPGCTYDAPWGPAGDDCPYPVLPSGNGTHARLEFGPETHAWQIFQYLIQDQGKQDYYGTTSVPFYGGFDVNGFLRVEPFDPGNLQHVVFFHEYDETGLAQIQSIAMNYCTAQMRSQVDFIGIDPWTNALQHYHIDQPEVTKLAIGYPSRWVERNARYSGDYLISAAKNGAAMSAIPQLNGTIGCSWIPYVSAGQRCLVYDSNTLGYMLDAYITRVDAKIISGDSGGQRGQRTCEAVYQIRAVANTPHIPGIATA